MLQVWWFLDRCALAVHWVGLRCDCGISHYCTILILVTSITMCYRVLLSVIHVVLYWLWSWSGFLSRVPVCGTWRYPIHTQESPSTSQQQTYHPHKRGYQHTHTHDDIHPRSHGRIRHTQPQHVHSTEAKITANRPDTIPHKEPTNHITKK